MKTVNLKRGGNRTTAVKLMTQTRGMRRQWILKDKPSVTEVLDVFPFLKDPFIVKYHKLNFKTYITVRYLSFRMSTGQYSK